MREAQSLRVEFRLELLANLASLDHARQRFVIDVTDTVEQLEIEDDAAAIRVGCTLYATATTPRRDRQHRLGWRS